ncbi:MAG: hypothetical protein FMNOHCHN_01741 [Ignavibacteriaceae bacterium]|nr:hypothetical protein [Ignavibacteriaceae bacterium]
MSLIKIFNVLFFVAVGANILHAQNVEPAATVGGSAITREYFENRFKLSPQLTRLPGVSAEKERYNFLYTLIAEKLWSRHASEMGLDTAAHMRRNFLPLERMYIRDALWQQEIASKVTVTPVEILQTFSKIRYSLLTKFVFTSDSVEALSFYYRLSTGEPIDSLLRGRPEADFQSDGFEIAYTRSNDAALEEKLYTLKNPGDVLKPHKDKEGWFVFQLLGIKDNISAENTAEKMQKTAKDLITSIKTDSVYQAFYKKFFPGISVESDGDLFWSLHAKVIYIMTRDSSKRKDNRYSVGMEYLDELEKSFGADSLWLPFLTLGKRTVPFSDFLTWFLFERFSVSTLDPRTIGAFMQDRVKFIIEQDLLYHEGLRRGLDKNPQVHEEITMWKEYYLSMKARELYTDSITISGDDVQEYYRDISSNPQTSVKVALAQLITDSLEVVQSVLDAVKNSMDFVSVIQDLEKKGSGDALINDLAEAESLGDVGYVAKVLNKGDVYGPLRIKERYILFKVLDKQADTIPPAGFDEVKEKLTPAVLKKKRDTALDKQTAALADRYGVQINESYMNSVDVENLKMFIFRFMGFGGRIAAFPVTPPYSRWTDEWKQKPQSLP